MSCWVAPAIAAELWGLSLNDIQEMILRGRLSSESNCGFCFVQLPQFLPRYLPFGTRMPIAQRPSTYSVVTPEELHALHNNSNQSTTNSSSSDDDEPADDDSEMGPPPDEDPQDNRIADWRAGRQTASRRRKPPGTFDA